MRLTIVLYKWGLFTSIYKFDEFNNVPSQHNRVRKHRHCLCIGYSVHIGCTWILAGLCLDVLYMYVLFVREVSVL